MFRVSNTLKHGYVADACWHCSDRSKQFAPLNEKKKMIITIGKCVIVPVLILLMDKMRVSVDRRRKLCVHINMYKASVRCWSYAPHFCILFLSGLML